MQFPNGAASFLSFRILLLDRLKILFSYTTKRAAPILGNILESCSGSDARLGVTNSSVAYAISVTIVDGALISTPPLNVIIANDYTYSTLKESEKE